MNLSMAVTTDFASRIAHSLERAYFFSTAVHSLKSRLRLALSWVQL